MHMLVIMFMLMSLGAVVRVLMAVHHAVFMGVLVRMYSRAVFVMSVRLAVIVVVEIRRAVAVRMIMAGAGLGFVCMIVHEWYTS
jgi:hypothetical protein